MIIKYQLKSHSEYQNLPIRLEKCENVLSIREDQLCPGLPQREHNIIYEPNLRKYWKTSLIT